MGQDQSQSRERKCQHPPPRQARGHGWIGTLLVPPPTLPLFVLLGLHQIGYIGTFAALGTFAAMVASIWLRHHGEEILDGFVEAFIIAVTIIVVAIPEGGV
jgi:hypothetical protein